MGNRAKGIFGSLPILAVAFGRRHGIEVQIGGSRARTDGKRIQLPAMPLECDDRLETLAYGFLFHETGHIEFTDLSEFAKAETPFLFKLLNAIEDVRMEAVRNATYPGSASTLAKLVGLLGKEGTFGTEERIAKAEPQDVLTHGVLTKLRSEVLEQPVGEATALWWSRLTELLGPAATIKLEVLLGQVRGLDTTADALALAMRIQTLVEQAAEEPPPPPEESPEANPEEQPQDQQEDQQQDQGDAGDSQDDSQPQGQPSSGDQQGNDDSQGDSSASTPQGADGAGDATQQADGSDQADASQDQGPAPDREAIRQALQATADQFMDTDLGDVLGKQLEQAAEEANEAETAAYNGEYQAPATTGLSVSKSTVTGQGELSEVLGQSQQLRTRLVAAMEAKARVKVTHRQQGKRLDGTRVHRLFTGDTRVFVRKDWKRRVNTAVHLLLDKSTSMDGDAIVLARRATLAACMGIGQIQGCKVAAAAFPQIEILKEFDEQTRGAAGRFEIGVNGSTPLAQAMIWAASQLAPRREERKMLIVLTDGDPDDADQVRKLVKLYQQSGVEVIGVGIGCQSVKDLYPVSIVINHIDELAGALFGVINERMRNAA